MMALTNGRLPNNVLLAIPGGRLEHSAAIQWNRMRAYIGQRHGIWITPIGPNASYRTYAAQEYFWHLYIIGRGNVAAHPGTSNHGWGKAVDVATTTMAYYVRKYGAQFGWSHAEGARVGEWWHFTYVGGTVAPPAPKPSPLRFLTDREKYVVNRLNYHRQQMLKQAKTGKGPKYQQNLKWARWYKKQIKQLIDVILAAHKLNPNWAVNHRGVRYQILRRVYNSN
jgi:hypothetical protein